MHPALSIRVIASYRRLSLAAFTITSLFILSPILATTFSIEFSPFTRYDNHRLSSDPDDEASSNVVCTPEQYSAGYWHRRPQSILRPMLAPEDVYPVSGFQGCASSREVDWHLAKGWSDERKDVIRSWRENVSAYDWVPGSGCESYSKPTQEELVMQLVERGGWLILGDSNSENHFFSLSCLLYPHVRATPNYTKSDYFDRAWQQDLFLEKSSPLVPFLRFPNGFDIDTTPLVTFRRVDLLLGRRELISIYENMMASEKDNPPPELFSDEAVWDLEPDIYLRLFQNPLPLGNYNTMILSTAGHWTTSLFSGFHNETVDGNGLANLLQFFEKAMGHWLERITRTLDYVNLESDRKGITQKQALVRAYLPGHDGCLETSVLLNGPVKKYNSSMSHSYNWGWIRRYNDVFKSLIEQHNHPNIHFLPIDNPGLLRPDGHAMSDCLHVITGAGILEGWTQYISYYLNFLP